MRGLLLLAAGIALAIPAGLAAEPGDAGVAPPSAMRIVAGDGQAGFADGRPGRFNKPIRLAPWGASDEPAVLVADIYNHAIRIVTSSGEVRTLTGRPDAKGHRDGPASEARFASPHGVAVSPQGRIAVAEAEGHTIRLIVPGLVPGNTGSRPSPGRRGRRASPTARPPELVSPRPTPSSGSTRTGCWSPTSATPGCG